MSRIILALALFAAAGCVSYADEPMTVEAVSAAAKDGVTLVGNDYIQARQTQNPAVLLVDVRTEEEFNLAHIPGAKWIPRGRSEFEFAKTVRDAEAEIILYCKTGSRASLVKKALDAQGYRNVTVHQGFETWAEAGLPVENALGLLTLIETPAD